MFYVFFFCWVYIITFIRKKKLCVCLSILLLKQKALKRTVEKENNSICFYYFLSLKIHNLHFCIFCMDLQKKRKKESSLQKIEKDLCRFWCYSGSFHLFFLCLFYFMNISIVFLMQLCDRQECCFLFVVLVLFCIFCVRLFSVLINRDVVSTISAV